MVDDPVVIAGYARTPIGGFQGELAGLRAPELGAAAISAALTHAGIGADGPDKGAVDEVFMGNVLPAGLGQAPARQAALGANLPESVPCTTVSKVCGSGMKAAMLAHDLLLAGTGTAFVAGGMESMTNAPYLLDKARAGYRLGHGALSDHMFLDGLEDAYDKGRLMGAFADQTAAERGISRAAQDAYASESLHRAQQAIEDGSFAAEIAPVTVPGRQGAAVVAHDEQPRTARIDKITTLKPAFSKDGTVTPANAASISDGAAALILTRRSRAEAHGWPVHAVIRGHAQYADAPARFTTAPIGALSTLLSRVGWGAREVDLYEINEAFAMVPLAAIDALDLPREAVNVHGGACALGHPIGASGARIVVTLLAALETYDLSRGVASLCIGGGEATALAIERV